MHGSSAYHLHAAVAGSADRRIDAREDLALLAGEVACLDRRLAQELVRRALAARLVEARDAVAAVLAHAASVAGVASGDRLARDRIALLRVVARASAGERRVSAVGVLRAGLEP